MRVDADVNDFIPEGSYLKDWFAVLQNNFASSGTSVDLYWVNDEAVRPPTSLPHTHPSTHIKIGRLKLWVTSM